MSSLNKCQIIGNLGRDPETRTMNDGSPVVNLTVATSDTWKSKDGEKRERVEWHKVVIFNEHICMVAKQYLRKGSKVFIEGSLQTREWTDQDGVKKYTTEIVLQRFNGQLVLLGEGSDQGSSQNSGEHRDTGEHRGCSSGGHDQGGGGEDDLGDGIPF